MAQARWIVPLAVPALAVAALAGCGSTKAAPASAAIVVPANPAAACDKPSTSFARFWFVTMEPVPGAYQGTQQVGPVRVPGNTMYVSGGAPGTGVLCVSAQAGVPDPIQSTAAPRPGAIAYLGAAGSPQDTVYFGTRPGVTRVTLKGVGDFTAVFSVNGPKEENFGTPDGPLESLGNGWHAANTGVGYSGGAMTLRAYNASGKLLGTVTEQYTAANPTPSGG